MGIFPHQQPQQGGFSPAVPPREAQPPAGVDLKRGILEHGVGTSGIGKGQAIRLDHRHTRHLLAVKNKSCGKASRGPSQHGASRPENGRHGSI